MLRVLLVNTVCLPGGVETHMMSLGRGLVSRGHAPSFYFYDGGTAHRQFESISDVTCGPAATLGELLCTADFDVLHANMSTVEWGFLRTLARIGYVGPTIITCHGRVVESDLYDRPGICLTAVSQYAADEVLQATGIRPRVIHNCVDECFIWPDSEVQLVDEPILLWVGRAYDTDKDITGLAAVTSTVLDWGWQVWVVDSTSDVRWNTLGEWFGAKCRILKNLAPREMAAIYRTTGASGGCLLYTSTREAFGIAAVEAMASRCPVVAPNVGGLPEVVTHMQTGLLYDRSGGVSAVVECLSLLSDTGIRERLVSTAGQAVRERFSAARMVDEYEAIYEAESKQCPKPARLTLRRRIAGAVLGARRHLRAVGHRKSSSSPRCRE